MCSVQIFKFLAKIYIINLIFSQEYIFIAFSQESAFSFSQVSNTHLAKIYTTRICVPLSDTHLLTLLSEVLDAHLLATPPCYEVTVERLFRGEE